MTTGVGQRLGGCCGCANTHAPLAGETSAPQEIRAFEALLLQNAPAKADLNQPLELLKKAFSEKQVRLEHPRGVYPLYNAVMKITASISMENQEALKESWKTVLTRLHQRKIYRIGLGEASFDTEVALNILKSPDNLPKVHAVPLDVKDHRNRQEILDYLMAADWEAFGTCIQRGFLEEIFKSDAVRCIVARDASNKIVGVLWGFFKTAANGEQYFHFWELSRKAPLAGAGIAKALIDCAKQQQRLYPNLKFATLNVDKSNVHAKELYRSEHFGPREKQDEELDKMFMARSLKDGQELKIPEEAKTAVRQFVVDTIPKWKLVWFELLRRLDLAWRWAWYR